MWKCFDCSLLMRRPRRGEGGRVKLVLDFCSCISFIVRRSARRGLCSRSSTVVVVKGGKGSFIFIRSSVQRFKSYFVFHFHIAFIPFSFNTRYHSVPFHSVPLHSVPFHSAPLSVIRVFHCVCSRARNSFAISISLCPSISVLLSHSLSIALAF